MSNAPLMPKATAVWLHEKHELSTWWAQTVTVRHERERGLREKYERPKGFEISVTRRVTAPATRAFDALSRPGDLSHWFTRGARANLEVGGSADAPVVTRAGLLRTARLLFDGMAYLHDGIDVPPTQSTE